MFNESDLPLSTGTVIKSHVVRFWPCPHYWGMAEEAAVGYKDIAQPVVASGSRG